MSHVRNMVCKNVDIHNPTSVYCERVTRCPMRYAMMTLYLTHLLIIYESFAIDIKKLTEKK